MNAAGCGAPMGGCGAVPAPNGCCCGWAVGEQLLSDDALLKWDNDFSISCSFRIFSCLKNIFCNFLKLFYIEISLKLLCCCSCCPPSASNSRAILFAGCSFSVLLVIISIFLKIKLFFINFFPRSLQRVLIVHPPITVRLWRTRVWRHVAGRRHQHCRMTGWHST